MAKSPLLILIAASLYLAPGTSQAQLSMTSAVDLALRNNPRVLGAQDDVKRAQAVVAQAHDVYIPTVSVGSGIGQAYGYLPYPPTLLTANAGSLIYSASQHNYIRSADAGLEAAKMSLLDVEETVAQDTALAFLALSHDQQRAQAIHEQFDDANRLVTISQQRFDAGQDTKMDLTQTQMTKADLRVASLRADDDVVNDREHLARLIGLPKDSLTIDGVVPDAPLPAAPSPGPYANSAVAAAFFNAQAKQEQAKGDSKVRFRPQVSLVVDYQRYATFTDSFKNLENTYKSQNNGSLLTSDETAFGVKIEIPFFDKARSDKAHESAAVAAHAQHDAENAQIDALDGQARLRHSIDELQAQADAANLHRQYAQQQLEVVEQQLQSGTGNPNAQPPTPKDEQNARIAERDKYIAALDAQFQYHQAEMQLLRQTGQLASWLGVDVSKAKAQLPNAPHTQPSK